MSRRNANGEGSIRRHHDGRWEARYVMQLAGKMKRRSIMGRTREEVARRLRSALQARDAGAQPVSAKETVAAYLETWLAGAASSLRPRTEASYRQIVRDHLVPRLGRIPLSRLQPQHVQAFLNDLLSAGLSPKTVRNALLVLHRALEQAVRWRLVNLNVAHLVDAPRVAAREMAALSADEARQVLAAAKRDDLEALWWLALTAGLRQGELLALKWTDVDLDRGSLRVVSSLIRLVGQEPQLGEPKSRRSRRLVELAAGALEALRRHRAASSSIGFVFTREDGRPLSVTTTWKRWRRLLTAAGVRPIRFHDAQPHRGDPFARTRRSSEGRQRDARSLDRGHHA